MGLLPWDGIRTIPFWQFWQIIFELSLHQLRGFYTQLIKLIIELLTYFATTRDKELYWKSSIGVKAYSKVKVVRARVNTRSSIR